MPTRRKFLYSAAAGIALSRANQLKKADDLLDVSALARYVDPLPIPRRASPLAGSKGVHYKIEMREFTAQVHRNVPPTTMWGYDGSSPGPVIGARKGEPVSVEWVNRLPQQHLLPIDHTLHGAEPDKPSVRTVVHLHGARVGPESDGYPEHWITPGQSQTNLYPNQQDATSLFYHDHAMGITRLNTAAGLMGLYLIRDEVEAELNLPRGEYEIPLVLIDRSFLNNGQLHYPVSGDPDKPWVSEYYGAGILANGKLFPYLDVQPRKYRFRVLNSSNGSFYVLGMARNTSFASANQSFIQIGSDQGLLPGPQSIDNVILGPGERADLIIDFAPYAGEQLYLRTKVAYMMQFRVGRENTKDSSRLPSVLRPVKRIPESTAVKTRELTLADYQNRLGQSRVMLLNGCHWDMPVTEKPLLDSTEIWSFVNLTDDSHPIHLHLVRFQILDRRPFDLQVYALTKKVVFTGPATALEPGEFGWKDTVRVDPMTVTRIIAKFEGFTGRYVWHCHMLEHEDNEMMRPYEIVAKDS